MKVHCSQYFLNFKQPSGTSRGVLTQKETWFIHLQNDDFQAIGECGLLRGLSADDLPDYLQKLQWTCKNIHLGEEKLWNELKEFPSIQFGIEQIFAKLRSKNNLILFDSEFSQGKKGIPINGLIWMGNPDFMNRQIRQKIEDGFRCIKLKIGALHFETEYEILKKIRREYSADEIEIRTDANGGFTTETALEKLKKLSDLQIHSVEQPIMAKQWEQMAVLCEKSPVPIALDEELIGIFSEEEKQKLLNVIRPQYIILKPSFVGGYKGSEEWISFAENLKIGWWITSALESNIGLNAIAQWTFLKNNPMPQGLGTGQLYTNNIEQGLQIKNAKLWRKQYI